MSSKERKLDEAQVLGRPFEEAEEHVRDWADDRIGEIRSLRKKDDFRKEFIGNLAHELKTPLFNIQGYVSSLLEGAMDDEQVKEKFLMKANKNIDRMTRIIEDLDTISQIESGLMELDLEKFNLTACAIDVIESLEKKAHINQVEVRVTSENSVMVLADEFRIGQVFTNLINNAITYGKEGGKVEVGITDFDDRVLVSVRDDGNGIDKEKIPRLFERFYRVDKSRSRDVGGTGLGLAIVKHIMEAHHQSVTAQSEVGKGSTFSFTLPKA
jgi:two-component system phosphate regulon sensor histidine kinase PhoR